MGNGNDETVPARPPWGSTWQETAAYVRAGGRLPPMYPDDYDGIRAVLVGAAHPATTEELVLYAAECHEMSDEDHDDPERVLAMLRRYGCDCVWDHEQGMAVPRDPNWSPWALMYPERDDPLDGRGE